MENEYKKYNVRRVINASGKMTILGGAKVSDDVCEQMNLGAKQFFEVKDLLNKTGDYLASLLHVEAAYIVNSASGGIAQSVAACISMKNCQSPLDLYCLENEKREIIICKGHNVDYGTPIELTIRLGGGKVVEAGYANTCTIEHVKEKITEKTAGLIYVKSHHCVQKGMPDISSFIELAHNNHLPVIIDAAAEEDLRAYYCLGADAVIYSGTKALEGPTSGLLIGKKYFIDHVKKQSQGIGRVMKVGKESILGLTYAIEKYLSKPQISLQQQALRFEKFNKKLNQVKGIQAHCIQDGAGRQIMRSQISFDEHQLKKSASFIAEKLKKGAISIYTRDYLSNVGKIEIDMRDVDDCELEMIYDKIMHIIGGENNE